MSSRRKKLYWFLYRNKRMTSPAILVLALPILAYALFYEPDQGWLPHPALLGGLIVAAILVGLGVYWLLGKSNLTIGLLALAYFVLGRIGDPAYIYLSTFLWMIMTTIVWRHHWSPPITRFRRARRMYHAGS